MRITCPKCQFKGLIDTGPLAFQTRVACVRCGTTFEAVLLDGEIMSSLPPDEAEEVVVAAQEVVAQEATPAEDVHPELEAQAEEDARFDSDAQFDSDAEAILPVSSSDEVLALPQTAGANYQFTDQAPVLEDVLLAPDAELVGPVEVLAKRQTVDVAEEGRAVAVECEILSPHASPLPDMAEVADDSEFKPDRNGVEAVAGYEGHSRGMRLMRISPLWLLVCAMVFVAVIVVSNQFAKPAPEQQQSVAMNNGVPDNKATNQALSPPLAPASGNHAATSVQDSSQMAAPAPVQLKSDEARAGAEKMNAETRVELKPDAAPNPVLEVAAKGGAHSPASASTGEQSGSLTIQVGSYNVIEQANDRVASLRAAGFDARVTAVELPKRGTWYRVQAGRFSGRAEAERYGQEMKAEGVVESFIITGAPGK